MKDNKSNLKKLTREVINNILLKNTTNFLFFSFFIKLTQTYLSFM